jgi:hypothetical protein
MHARMGKEFEQINWQKSQLELTKFQTDTNIYGLLPDNS